MDKLKTIIIEDEPLALKRLISFVNKVPFLELLDAFESALDGLTFLKTESVDLLFLDINMDEISGIELIESADLRCQIIITTAYPQYALKGFELHVTDYLLKPFTFNRLLQASTRALELKNRPQNSIVSKNKNFVFIKTENRLEKVMLDQIIYIEGMREYRRIHTSGKSIMTLQTFGDLENMIPIDQVCRVHKSYMVSISKIESIERGRIVIGNERIPISASYKNQLYEQLNLG